MRDKLFVGNKLLDPGFERSPLTPKVGKTFSSTLANISSSNIMSEKGSSFQAHSLDISSTEEACEGLAAIIKQHTQATHRVYAYRYVDQASGDVKSDDGEWGASKHIMAALNTTGQSRIIIVTRYHGGQNLGQKRFELYKAAAITASQ